MILHNPMVSSTHQTRARNMRYGDTYPPTESFDNTDFSTTVSDYDFGKAIYRLLVCWPEPGGGRNGCGVWMRGSSKG